MSTFPPVAPIGNPLAIVTQHIVCLQCTLKLEMFYMEYDSADWSADSLHFQAIISPKGTSHIGSTDGDGSQHDNHDYSKPQYPSTIGSGVVLWRRHLLPPCHI